MSGSARIDHIPGIQGHILTHIADNNVRVEQQIAEIAGLDYGAIHSDLNASLVPVKAGRDNRAQRRKSIAPLGPPPLKIIFLPFAFILMVFIIGVSQWMNPMRPDHLAAVLLQTIPMYLLFCLTGNILSILSPIALKPGSGKPASHQGIRVLFQIVFMLVVSVLIGFTLIPLGVEELFASMKWAAWFPAFLVLGIVQVAVMLWLYRVALNWQGGLLQRHEQRILEIVSLKAE